MIPFLSVSWFLPLVVDIYYFTQVYFSRFLFSHFPKFRFIMFDGIMKIFVVLPARFCVSSLPLHIREGINFGQVHSFVARKILFSMIRIGARGLIGVEFRA